MENAAVHEFRHRAEMAYPYFTLSFSFWIYQRIKLPLMIQSNNTLYICMNLCLFYCEILCEIDSDLIYDGLWTLFFSNQ